MANVYLNNVIFFLFLISISCVSQEERSLSKLHDHSTVYVPKCYRCYQTTPDFIKIDGKIDEEEWNQAPWTDPFVDIEGSLKPLPAHDTKIKMLWDDTYFYIAAKMEEPYIWATLHQRDTVVFYDDDFEIFIDPDGDTHNYYEIEVNAFNTIWDLFLTMPYRENHSPKVLNTWDIRGLKSSVYIDGTINDHSDQDNYWSVELAIPWKEISELAPRKEGPKVGDQWRINFSRVDWPKEIVNGKYVRSKNSSTGKPLPADNWVWSPQGYVAMHQPETWGFVQFESAPNTAGPCIIDPEDQIKWALRNLYFQQATYLRKEGKYIRDISMMTLPKLTMENYSFEPVLENTSIGYLISVPSIQDAYKWFIREDGKVWKAKNTSR